MEDILASRPEAGSLNRDMPNLASRYKIAEVEWLCHDRRLNKEAKFG